jgi:hypothetical protein
MTLRRLPSTTIAAVLALCVLAHLLAVSAAHSTLHVSVSVDALTAGGGVALERLAHGDPGGAFEAVAAIFRG